MAGAVAAAQRVMRAAMLMICWCGCIFRKTIGIRTRLCVVAVCIWCLRCCPSGD